MWKERFRRNNKLRSSRNLLKLAKIIFLLVLLGSFTLFVVFPLLALNLPSPDKVVRREGFSTKILDRNGSVLYDIFSDQRRIPVKIAEVPDNLKKATIAIEDKNFYKHQGFDPTGIFRALLNTILRGRVQGGSTLTQQLVKNVLLNNRRTILRKVQEFILALQIERRYSKDQILQMYLNEAPYGGTAWGSQAAAETYFGKSVKDLSLVESAVLAGFPQRPSYYSPYSGNPKAYIGRTQEVLRRMREDGYISRSQESEARKTLENLTFQEKGAGFKAQHFVQFVQKILEERYGEKIVELGGLKVTTTLDLDLQEKTQKIVAEEISKVEKLRITNGAAVVLDSQTGEILAMVGSKDFNAVDYDGQVNVTTSLRQPGSAMKPFTYLTALKKGYSAASLLMDVPTVFPGGENLPDYEPVNYDGKYRGPIQMRFALANSINVAAVKMLAKVGIKDTLETGNEMGITTLSANAETLKRVGLSLTLGGGEVKLLDLTAAYAPIMNAGFKAEPVSILKVEDNNGRVLEEIKPKKGKSVLSSEIAYLIYDILSDNDARSEVFGLNSLLNISGKKIAVKTGTTNDKRDNWTVGGYPGVTVGVWVGNNDNSPMLQVASGVTGASPIWRKILLEFLSNHKYISFDRPEGVVSASVDKISGYREHDGFDTRTEYFVKGTEPGDDPVHVKLKVCKNDGKLATPSDIAAGNYEEKEFFVFKEEDPLSSADKGNKWQEGVLNWLSTQADPRYHPPEDYCGSTNPVNVEFINPADRTSNLPNNFSIKVKADSTSEITEVDLEIDGKQSNVFNSLPFEAPVSLTDGTHKLVAKARDAKGNIGQREIAIGVNVAWDFSPSPSPTP